MSETEWLDIFGNNLKDILMDEHISQKELANMTGLSESTISSYINKKKIPSLKAIINISYALDIDYEDLIDFGSYIL